MNNAMPLLSVKYLEKVFPIGGGLFQKPRLLHATRSVSFTLEAGQTLGIVGESGSGKSTIGRCILRLHEPTSGKIVFDGTDGRFCKASAGKTCSYCNPQKPECKTGGICAVSNSMETFCTEPCQAGKKCPNGMLCMLLSHPTKVASALLCGLVLPAPLLLSLS